MRRLTDFLQNSALVLLFLLGSLGSALATDPLGTKLAEFDRAVIDMVRDPIRARIYATTSVNTVLVIDTTTLTIAAEIGIGSNPRGLDVSVDGTRLFVANSGSTAAGIGVIDLTTLKKLPSLSTTVAPLDVAVGLSGHLYVLAQGSLLQLDSANGNVQATLVSGTMNGRYVDFYGGVLAITPDRKSLIYGDTGLSPSTLYKFDVSGTTIAFSAASNFNALGSNGEDLGISDDGTVLFYATGSGQGNYGMSLIPVANLNSSLGLFNTGAYPHNGAFSPDGSTFFAGPAANQQIASYNTTTFVANGSFSSGYVAKLLCDHSGRFLFAAGDSTYNSTAVKLTVYSTGMGIPLVTSAAAATAHQDQDFSFNLTSNLPVTWKATGLPAGLTLNATTGAISGKPAAAGKFSLAVTATTSSGDIGKSTVTLTVLTPFVVQVTGQGSVTSTYSGTSWREVGSSFLVVATPDSGNGFLGWSGSITSSALTLGGTVQPKMTLNAAFGGLTTLTVHVVGPGSVPSQYFGASTQTVGANVDILASALPGARFVGWSGAKTSNLADLSFVVQSAMHLTATFETVPKAQLSVSIVGSGSVTPSLAGVTTQVVGSKITLMASANYGSRFTGWSGSIISLQPQISCSFDAAMTLTANFEPLDYYRGNYHILADSSVGVLGRKAIDLTLNPDGFYSAVLVSGTTRFAFAGSFLFSTGADVSLAQEAGQPPLLVHLNLLNSPSSGPTITGTIDVGSGPRQLSGYRAASGTQSSLLAGAYSMMLPSAPIVGAGGYGYGRAKVSKLGNMRLSGILGDGTAFSASAMLYEGNWVPVSIPLYSKAGYIDGWLRFRNVAGESDFDGVLGWSKPAKVTASVNTPSFTRA